MGSVQSLNTANFQFTITGIDAEGNYTLEIKPTTKTGKDLFRFKKWGKVQTMFTTKAFVFGDVDAYEDKVLKLAPI